MDGAGVPHPPGCVTNGGHPAGAGAVGRGPRQRFRGSGSVEQRPVTRPPEAVAACSSRSYRWLYVLGNGRNRVGLSCHVARYMLVQTRRAPLLGRLPTTLEARLLHPASRGTEPCEEVCLRSTMNHDKYSCLHDSSALMMQLPAKPAAAASLARSCWPAHPCQPRTCITKEVR